jgi:hypothetical protein
MTRRVSGLLSPIEVCRTSELNPHPDLSGILFSSSFVVLSSFIVFSTSIACPCRMRRVT